MTPKKMPHSQSRSMGPVPLTPLTLESRFPAEFFDSDDDDPTRTALEATNDDIRSRLSKLQANAFRLKREIWLLQRHVKDFHHPLYENWEADILTRLVEVAHVNQPRKLPGGVSIGESNTAERENLALAYSNAAKHIAPATLRKLGLGDKYYQALLRYPEVVAYRSPNPFQTEVAFAKWLVEERENRPEKYFFWAKLYPVCYGRTVEQSSAIF